MGSSPIICANQLTKAINYTIEELIIYAVPEKLLTCSLKSNSTCGTVKSRRSPQSLNANNIIYLVKMAFGIAIWAFAADFKDEYNIKPPAILFSN